MRSVGILLLLCLFASAAEWKLSEIEKTVEQDSRALVTSKLESSIADALTEMEDEMESKPSSQQQQQQQQQQQPKQQKQQQHSEDMMRFREVLPEKPKKQRRRRTSASKLLKKDEKQMSNLVRDVDNSLRKVRKRTKKVTRRRRRHRKAKNALKVANNALKNANKVIKSVSATMKKTKKTKRSRKMKTKAKTQGKTKKIAVVINVCDPNPCRHPTSVCVPSPLACQISDKSCLRYKCLPSVIDEALQTNQRRLRVEKAKDSRAVAKATANVKRKEKAIAAEKEKDSDKLKTLKKKTVKEKAKLRSVKKRSVKDKADVRKIASEKKRLYQRWKSFRATEKRLLIEIKGVNARVAEKHTKAMEKKKRIHAMHKKLKELSDDFYVTHSMSDSYLQYYTMIQQLLRKKNVEIQSLIAMNKQVQRALKRYSAKSQRDARDLQASKAAISAVFQHQMPQRQFEFRINETESEITNLAQKISSVMSAAMGYASGSARYYLNRQQLLQIQQNAARLDKSQIETLETAFMYTQSLKDHLMERGEAVKKRAADLFEDIKIRNDVQDDVLQQLRESIEMSNINIEHTDAVEEQTAKTAEEKDGIQAAMDDLIPIEILGLENSLDNAQEEKKVKNSSVQLAKEISQLYEKLHPTAAHPKTVADEIPAVPLVQREATKPLCKRTQQTNTGVTVEIIVTCDEDADGAKGSSSQISVEIES